MVRVIYLLSITGLKERRRLIQATLNGEEWDVKTLKGRSRRVTDRQMVDLAQQLEGWTQSVYKFGCAFIHLSHFHNHLCVNPFDKLSKTEKNDLLSHMRHYHGGPPDENPTIEQLSAYVPKVFDKIAGNLECYLAELERGGAIETSIVRQDSPEAD